MFQAKKKPIKERIASTRQVIQEEEPVDTPHTNVNKTSRTKAEILELRKQMMKSKVTVKKDNFA